VTSCSSCTSARHSGRDAHWVAASTDEYCGRRGPAGGQGRREAHRMAVELLGVDEAHPGVRELVQATLDLARGLGWPTCSPTTPHGAGTSPPSGPGCSATPCKDVRRNYVPRRLPVRYAAGEAGADGRARLPKRAVDLRLRHGATCVGRRRAEAVGDRSRVQQLRHADRPRAAAAVVHAALDAASPTSIPPRCTAEGTPRSSSAPRSAPRRARCPSPPSSAPDRRRGLPPRCSRRASPTPSRAACGAWHRLHRRLLPAYPDVTRPSEESLRR